MDEWKRLICRGNRCFELGDLVRACALYQEALGVAESLLPTWPDADAAIAAFVVSHHNLADLHVRLDCLEDAADHLLAAHARLMRMVADEKVPLAAQQAALRHSQRTLAERLVFSRTHSDRAAPSSWRPPFQNVSATPPLH